MRVGSLATTLEGALETTCDCLLAAIGPEPRPRRCCRLFVFVLDCNHIVFVSKRQLPVSLVTTERTTHPNIPGRSALLPGGIAWRFGVHMQALARLIDGSRRAALRRSD